MEQISGGFARTCSDVKILADAKGRRLNSPVWLTCWRCYNRFEVLGGTLDGDSPLVCTGCGASSKATSDAAKNSAIQATIEQGVLYRFVKTDECWLGVLRRNRVKGDNRLLLADLYPILDDFSTYSTEIADPYNLVPCYNRYWLASIQFPQSVHERKVEALERMCNTSLEPCAPELRDLIIPRESYENASNQNNSLLPWKPIVPASASICKLTPSQAHAVNAVVNSTETLRLIQGPPGTGKSTVAAAIVFEWTTQASCTTPILACAGTHAAVNTLREKLRQLGVSVQSLSHPDGSLSSEASESIEQNAKVFVDTVYQASKLRKLDLQAERVLIDESSQMIEYSALIGVTHGCKKLVLVGDQQQLSPISPIHEEWRSAVGPWSLFERLGKHSNVTPLFLDTQFRMPYPLCEFSSQHFYDGKLKTDYAVQPCDMKLPDSLPWPETPDGSKLPLLFIDSANEKDPWQCEQKSCNSRQNPVEVELVSWVVERLRQSGVGKDQIVVLTPYNGHRKILKKRLHNQDDWDASVGSAYLGSAGCRYEAIPRVTTVDGFQGFENDFIIFSSVRSNMKSEIGFLKDFRRMNVALTRARKALIFVGDSNTLKNGDGLWKDWVKHTEDLGARKSIWTNREFFTEALQSEAFRACEASQPYLRHDSVSDVQARLRLNVPEEAQWKNERQIGEATAAMAE